MSVHNSAGDRSACAASGMSAHLKYTIRSERSSESMVNEGLTHICVYISLMGLTGSELLKYSL